MWRPGGVALNTALSAVRSVLRMVVGFALLPVLVDDIGSARTGLFLFATTVAGYFTAIELSVGSSLTRYVAAFRARGEQDELAAVVRASLALMLLIGLLTGAVLVAIALLAGDALFREPALRSAVEPTLLVAAGAAVFYWPSRVGLGALTGLERYDQLAIIQMASSVVVLAGIAILAGRGASVPVLTGFFAATTVLEGVAAAALAWRPLGARGTWVRGGWVKGEHTRAILGFGAAAFAIGIADTLIYSLDRTIVSAVVGAAAIVGYELALRPHTAVRTIAGITGLALVAPAARLATQLRTERLRELVLVSSFVGITVTAPVAWLVIVLARPFVRAWLGPAFGHDSVYVQIFTSYWLVACCTTAASSALYGIGALRRYAVLAIVQAVVALALSLVLALAWGTVGVIWGTVIPAWISAPVFVVLALPFLHIELREFLQSVVVPAYGLVVPWAAITLLADLVLRPSGYPGIVAFATVSLASFWAVAGPRLRSRWRLASRAKAS